MPTVIRNNIGIFNNHFKGSNDVFRELMGLYWDIFDGEKLVPNSLPLTKLNIGSTINYGVSFPYSQHPEDLSFKQEIVFIPSADESTKAFLQGQFKSTGITNEQALINFLKEGKEIEDFSFSYQKTVPKSEQVENFWATQQSEYNFYVREYENIIEKIPEEVLPNYYIFSLAMNKDLLKSVNQKDYNNNQTNGPNSPYFEFQKKFDNLITLDNNIVFDADKRPTNLEKYYSHYANHYDNVSVDFVSTYKKKFGNTITSFENQEMYDKLNANKSFFPFNTELSWYKDKSNSFFELLKKSNIEIDSIQSFILDKILTENNNGSFMQTFFESSEKIFTNGGSVEYKTSDHLMKDFDRWFKEYIQNLNNNIPKENKPNAKKFTGGAQNSLNSIRGEVSTINNKPISTIGGERMELNSNQQGPSLDSLVQDLIKDNTKYKYKEILLENLRTYKEILKGNFANDDILFFRIEKREKKTNNLIQNFYMMNIPNINIMNYIDTQVKYNKEYSYKIFSNHLVYGTKYKYVLKETKDELIIGTGASNSVDMINNGAAGIRAEGRVVGNSGGTQINGNKLTVPTQAKVASEQLGYLASRIVKPQDYSIDLEPMKPQSSFDTGAILIPIGGNSDDEPPLNGEAFIGGPVYKPRSNPDSDYEPTSNKVARKLTLPDGEIASDLEDDGKSSYGEPVYKPIHQSPKNVNEENAEVDALGNPHQHWDYGKQIKDKYIFDVIYTPIVKLVECEYSQEIVTKVVDLPPSLPDVSFIPIMNTSGSFNIALQESSYEYEDYFIPILSTDPQYNDTRIGGLIAFNMKTKFRGQGDTSEFQVFRLDKSPTSYRDFGLYKTLKFPDESCFLETIDPNKKYYYTFRIKDLHGNLSNPTAIYTAFIYNDQLLFIPEFSVMKFKDSVNYDWSKSVKKYIKISPNFIHKLWNDQNSRLGLGEKNIYDKQFLMKIKSKHSGRVLDVFFKFNLDKNKES